MPTSSCPPLFTECGRSRSCNHRDPSATPPTLQTTHAYHDHAASAAATADGISRLKKQIGKLLSKTGSEFRRFDAVKITSKSMNNNAAERALLLSLLPFGQSQSDRVDSGFADKHAARAPVSFSAGSIAHSSRRARAGRPQITPCFDRINDDLPFLTERRRSQGLCDAPNSLFISLIPSALCLIIQVRVICVY